MSSDPPDEQKRQAAAEAAFRDVVWMLESSGKDQTTDEIDGAQVVALLRRNFKRLDPDKRGISRAELLAALGNPSQFDRDEYAMLSLVSRYFDMIIQLSDDEAGPETRITRKDAAVMAQFLLHAKMSLSALNEWMSKNKKPTASGIEPPPLAGD
jgi:hypothetical protein